MAGRRSRLPTVVALALVALGVIAAAVAGVSLSQRERIAVETAFAERARRQVHRLRDGFRDRERRLGLLAALVAAAPPADAEAFRRLAAQAYPDPRDEGLRMLLLAAPRAGGGATVLAVMPPPATGKVAGHAFDAGGPEAQLVAAPPRPGGVAVVDGDALLRRLAGRGGRALLVRADAPRIEDAGDRHGPVVLALVSVQELLDSVFREMGPLEDVRILLAPRAGAPAEAIAGAAPVGERPWRGPVRVLGAEWYVEVHPGRSLLLVPEPWLRPAVLVPSLLLLLVAVVGAALVAVLGRGKARVEAEVEHRVAELRTKTSALEAKERELEEANRRLLEMSNTDALTGLVNRRGFEVQLDKERERARRTGRPFGVLLFDVDLFKGYNDAHGHLAGDEALQHVAGIIRGEARRIDCVARYGGEEFVVVVADADPAGLLALAERIRSRIREAGIEHLGSPYHVLTVCGGGSLSRPDDEHRAEPVLQRADDCLYDAKASGRDRVSMRVEGAPRAAS